jgi:hypothetical protein
MDLDEDTARISPYCITRLTTSKASVFSSDAMAIPLVLTTLRSIVRPGINPAPYHRCENRSDLK